MVQMPAFAQTAKPEAIYEQRCFRCHKMPIEALASKKLTIDDGKLVSIKNGREASLLLQDHFSTQLTTEEISALIDRMSTLLVRGQ